MNKKISWNNDKIKEFSSPNNIDNSSVYDTIFYILDTNINSLLRDKMGLFRPTNNIANSPIKLDQFLKKNGFTMNDVKDTQILLSKIKTLKISELVVEMVKENKTSGQMSYADLLLVFIKITYPTFKSICKQQVSNSDDQYKVFLETLTDKLGGKQHNVKVFDKFLQMAFGKQCSIIPINGGKRKKVTNV
jgi:hypothetical protein